MTLQSLTFQDIFDGRNKETVYSGGESMDFELKKNFIDDCKRISSDFINGGKPNTGSGQPNNSIARDSTSYSNCRSELIDDLFQPMQLRTVRNSSSRLETRSLTPLMEWEGSVEAIKGEEFVARLVNVATGELPPTEEARFPISELSDFQRENLKTGAIFRWVIGLQRLPNGNKQRVSELFFRRFPAAHSEKEINATVAGIGIHLDALEWDGTPSR